MRSKCEGSLRQGTPRIHASGLVNVKTKVKRPKSVKMNVTLLDDVGVFQEGTMRSKTSSTQRAMIRSAKREAMHGCS